MRRGDHQPWEGGVKEIQGQDGAGQTGWSSPGRGVFFEVRRARGSRGELQPQQKHKAHPLGAEPSWLSFKKTWKGSEGLAAGLQQVALPLPGFQQRLQGQHLPGPARDQRPAEARKVLGSTNFFLMCHLGFFVCVFFQLKCNIPIKLTLLKYTFQWLLQGSDSRILSSS